MFATFLDNPTREKIILHLKKNGHTSIDSLSKEVGITPMGVRQHLLILERNGMVEYFSQKKGVGRPLFYYKLTETAEELFPKSYQEFVIDVLTDIENHDGKEKIDEIFRRRKERNLMRLKRLLSGKDSVADRLSALAEHLIKDGYIVELHEGNKEFRVSIFNCPISKVTQRFKDACKYQALLLRELLRKEIAREQCMSEGSHACVYIVNK